MKQYRVMHTDLNGYREDTPVIKRKAEAVKIAKDYIKQGHTDVIVDVYAPNRSFDGTPNYEDIVWEDYIVV